MPYPPPATGPSEQAIASLARLLTDLFSPFELIQFVSGLEQIGDLMTHLPYRASAAELAAAVAGGLGRRGALDEDFWEALAAARPSRSGDIQAIRFDAPTRAGRRWYEDTERVRILLATGATCIAAAMFIFFSSAPYFLGGITGAEAQTMMQILGPVLCGCVGLIMGHAFGRQRPHRARGAGLRVYLALGLPAMLLAGLVVVTLTFFLDLGMAFSAYRLWTSTLVGVFQLTSNLMIAYFFVGEGGRE